MGAGETSPHLFVMRIWMEPEGEPPRFARGIIEHVPSGEHRYFRDLGEIQAFISSQLTPPPSKRETLDA